MGPLNHRIVKNRRSGESPRHFLALRGRPAAPQSSRAPRRHRGCLQGFRPSPCSVTDVQPSHVGDCRTQTSVASGLRGAARCPCQWCRPPAGIGQASWGTHCELHTLPGPCPGAVTGPRGTTDSKAKMMKQCTSSSNRNRNNLQGELYVGLTAADVMLPHGAVTHRGGVHRPEIQQRAPALRGPAPGTGERRSEALPSTSCISSVHKRSPLSPHDTPLPAILSPRCRPAHRRHHLLLIFSAARIVFYTVSLLETFWWLPFPI